MEERLRSAREKVDRWLRRHPLFAAACVALIAVFAVQGFWRGLLILAVGIFSGNSKRSAVWLLVALLAGAGFWWRTSEAERQSREMVAAGPLKLQAEIVGDPKGEPEFWSASARVISGPFVDAKLSWRGRGDMPVKGSLVRAQGHAMPLPEPRNPGEFDKADWLRQQGVVAVFEASTATQVHTGKFAAWQADLRRKFRTAVTAGLEETSRASMVIRAVVIGEMPKDEEELVASYRDSGTLHVFSVSGLHVAMVASMGWFVLKWVGVPRRRAVLGLLPLVFGYSWLTGNSAPALRSAWMTAVFLGAFVFRRQGDLLNALGAVLLVGVLWDGRMIYQPGVQLSYGVVAVIAVGVGFTERWFERLKQPDLLVPQGLMTRGQAWRRNLRRKTARYFSVSIAAWAGSTPLTIWHFGVVTPVSILAGIPILPMVYLLLVLGLASEVVHPWVPAVARGINQVNGKLADATTWVARGFSSLPGGHFSVKSREPFLLVYDLPRGAGAACFSNENDAVLLDAADRAGFKYHVAPSLKMLGISPETLVFSHPDGAHLGGGEKIWETFPIRQVLLPVAESRSPAFKLWQEEAIDVKRQVAQTGGKLRFGENVWLEILHAPPGDVRVQADQRVAIFRLHWKGWKILFTSDAGTDTEAAILQTGNDCSADVIVCGRPRHDSNLSDAFLTAVYPRAIIASNAVFPANETLLAEQVRYWKNQGIQVLDQQKTGGVTLTLGRDHELILRGFVDGSEVKVKK
ncbi:MAG: ComEC/Rec2 family competence protein [Luteolibacter sp.]